MFRLIAIFSALCAVASAGYLGGYGALGHGYGYGGLGHGYGLGYGSGYGSYGAYHAPLVAAPVVKTYSAPILKSYAAPIVAAPVVKTIAPVATSYANTYKIATKAVPVVHAAPALAVHAAPAVVAAPALHTTSSYHGSYGHYGYGGYGLGLNDYGYGHSLYH